LKGRIDGFFEKTAREFAEDVSRRFRSKIVSKVFYGYSGIYCYIVAYKLHTSIPVGIQCFSFGSTIVVIV